MFEVFFVIVRFPIDCGSSKLGVRDTFELWYNIKIK